MNRYILLITVFIFNYTLTAQSKYVRRLTYDRMGLLYETGQEKGTNQNTKLPYTTNLGNALGLQIHVNPTYLGQEDNQKTVLGWSLNLDMGWNITSSNVAPYVFDIGFWGGHLITDDLEIGAQYCFLGVYGYQKLAHFGASLSPAIRYKRFQLTFTRRGAGAIRGAFFPKDPSNNYPQHSLELMYNLGEAFLIGVRGSSYHPMDKSRDINELRVFVAMSLLQESYLRSKSKK